MDRFIHIQLSPSPFRRKFIALDLDLLMMVIAVCLTSVMHPIAVDTILTVLTVWVMRGNR